MGGDRDGDAGFAGLAEAPVTGPAVSKRVEMGVGGNRDGGAGAIGFPVAPVTFPPLT
jgi:hypothetical protein